MQFAEILRPEILIDYVGIDDRLKRQLASDLDASVIEPPQTGRPEPGVHATVVHGRDSLRGRTIFLPKAEASFPEMLALGWIPPEWRAPWEATGAAIREYETLEEFVTAQVGAKPSPISLTRAATGAYEASGFLGGPVIVFSGRMTPWDLLTFWNVRAATVTTFGRVHVLYVPLQRLADPILGVILRDLSLQQLSVPDVVFHGRDTEEIKAAADALGFEEGTGGVKFTFAHPVRPRDLASNPFTYRLNLDPRTWVLVDRKDGVRTPVSVNLTRPRLVVRSEVGVPLQPFAGLVRIDLQEIPTLQWPASTSVGRLIHPDATFGRQGLSFLETPSRLVDKTLRVPSAEQVASALLADRGVDWHISDKGRYGQSLISRVGPVARLESLRSPESIQTVVALASMRRTRATRMLQDAGVSADDSLVEGFLRDLLPEQRWRTAGEVAGELGARRDRIVRRLTQLVRDGLVHRGLGFRCSRCTLRSVIPMERVSDEVACEGCGVRSPITGPGDSEPELRYALNSLFDRVVEQDCLGHLLSLPLVERWHSAEWSIPGALVQSADPALNREVDILAVSRQRLIMGEVKATSSAFTTDEVADNLRLAERIGAKLLILASLDDWSDNRKSSAHDAGEAAGVETVCYGITDLVSGAA
jgi:hypothetical protein